MARFPTPGPVDAREDALFSTRPEFLLSLQAVADHIAHPALSSIPFPSMTFAVYGPWGAGKSSALRVIESMVRARLKPPQLYTVSYFDSPRWQHVKDVRAALALAIIKDLSPETRARLLRTLDVMREKDPKGPTVLPDEWNLRQGIALQEALEHFSTAPPVLEEWLEQIALTLEPDASQVETDSPPPVRIHTVFIDDLDRCSEEYTASVLMATTMWSRVHNLFFVVAANREHLMTSLAKYQALGPAYPEQALEKYIHLAVELPGLLDNAEEVAEYIKKLLSAFSTQDNNSREQIEQLERLLDASAIGYASGNCLLAPLLRPSEPRVPLNEVPMQQATDVDVASPAALTPRGAKHRLSAFLVEFRPPPSGHLDEERVKLWILKSFWPTFWWNYIWRVGLPNRNLDDGEEWKQTVVWLERIVRIGQQLLPLWGLERPALSVAVSHLAKKEGLELTSIDPHLVLYLAMTPQWKSPPRPGSEDIKGPQRSSMLSSASDGDDEPLTDVEDQLQYAYLTARQALEAGAKQEALRHLHEVQRLAGLPLPPLRGTTVGNAALLAERLDEDDLAYDLHVAALRTDPTHYNMMQNFADFVIERRLQDHYDSVELLLERLRTTGSRHKPLRTAVLELRFDVARGLNTTDLGRRIESVLVSLAEDASVSSLVTVVTLLREIGDFRSIRAACEQAAATASSDQDRYTILRLLADSLPSARADSPEEDKTEAADLYMYMIRSGLACRPGQVERSGVKHNLAATIATLDYANAAALLWQEVYATAPHDEQIRRGFASHLANLGLNAEATTVLLGQALEPLNLVAEPLPVPFSSGDVHRWWEELKIGTYAPCPSFLTR